MGFPRILSKNNKIYTKLGEFCLSGDSFWIVCHTCQEELQTQDQFWKHIQDEHNFMHGVAKDHSRTPSYCLTDVEAAGTATSTTAAQAGASVTSVTVPLALYHCATKYTDEEQREVSVELHEAQQHLHQQHQQQQNQRDSAKELAELHSNVVSAGTAGISANEGSTRSSSSAGIDIKVEPASLTLPHEIQTANTSTMYHLPLVSLAPPSNSSFVSAGTTATVSTTPPLVTVNSGLAVTAASNATSNINTVGAASSTVLQQQTTTVTLPTLSLSVTPTTVMATAGATLLAQQELPGKESSSNAASAGSAVSSDDGERWYICDYETCGLKFKYKSRMELHRVVHSRERRFNCDLCAASFKQSCNLSTHRKKKHALRGLKTELLS